VVPLDDAHTVTIRRITRREYNDALSKSYRMTVAPGGQPDWTVDAVAFSDLLLKAAITAWDGPEFDGEPPTPANIDRLPRDLLDPVAKANDDWNRGLSADERNLLTAPSS
jgi:hypothetical protein